MNDLLFVSLAQAALPKIVETKRSDIILWGENNLYPNKLIEYNQRNCLHNAIIRSKVNDICGDGVAYDGKTDKKSDAFIMNPNPFETLDEVIKKLAYDLSVFGGFALNVIWSRDRKYVSELYHLDFANVRSGKMDEKKRVNDYFYSEDWAAQRVEYKAIPAFNPLNAGTQPSQIYYFKSYNPGLKYYPLPSYIGAVSSIETGIEIDNFHLAHLKNGMTPNIMITFTNGIPTQDERKKIEKQIKDKYVGTDNAGKFILNFADDASRAPVVTTLSPPQLDKQFIQLEQSVLQNILSGHGVVSPMLVGIPAPVGLGGTEIIQDSWELYHNRVINPFKNDILNVINKFTSINRMKELYINTSSPVSFKFSENVLQSILTQDELREMIGYDPIEQVEPEQPKEETIPEVAPEDGEPIEEENK